MKTTDLLQRLQERYALPEWAYFEQVRDAAGFDASRTADALAMNLWPGRGLEIHGFEVKVSRADWRKELKNPAKAEAVSQFCDRWWVVVSDPKFIKEGELPPTWGLLAPRGKGLAKKVDAPKLDPAPLDRSFVAAILKRATGSKFFGTTQARVDQEVMKQMEEVNKRARAAVEEELNDARSETDAWQEAVQAFEVASGVTIERYNARAIGEAVRLVLDIRAARWQGPLSEIGRVAELANELAEKFTAVDAQLRGGDGSQDSDGGGEPEALTDRDGPDEDAAEANTS